MHGEFHTVDVLAYIRTKKQGWFVLHITIGYISENDNIDEPKVDFELKCTEARNVLSNTLHHYY